MPIMKVIDVKFLESTLKMKTNGCKKGTKSSFNHMTGIRSYPTGYGQQVNYNSNEIIMTVENDQGDQFEILAGKQFRKEGYAQKLTKRFGNRAADIYPSQIDVEIIKNKNSGDYLILTENALKNWYQML